METNKQHIVWHDDVLVKQFISYAIGCMMGRYSLDKPGLILANQGDTLKEYQEQVPSPSFMPDEDGILPLMDENSPFPDNVVTRLAEWVKVALGAEWQTANLNCMETALGKSLTDYLAKDFWKDHKKMYQNRPIYWLFASKKGAFSSLGLYAPHGPLHHRQGAQQVPAALHRMAEGANRCPHGASGRTEQHGTQAVAEFQQAAGRMPRVRCASARSRYPSLEHRFGRWRGGELRQVWRHPGKVEIMKSSKLFC